MYTREWSPEEMAIIETHYPTGGSEACVPLLHDRSANAVRQTAQRNDIKGPHSTKVLQMREDAAKPKPIAPLSPSKQKKLAQMERRRSTVLAILEAAGRPLVVEEILEAAPHGSGVTAFFVGSMVRAGVLDSMWSGQRKPNWSKILWYTVAKPKKRPKKVKKPVTLEDVWKMKAPTTTPKPYVIFDMDREKHYGQTAMTPYRSGGVQSSMMGLINAFGE